MLRKPWIWPDKQPERTREGVCEGGFMAVRGREESTVRVTISGGYRQESKWRSMRRYEV